MTRIHPPHYQSINEYHGIGSFRVVEQNINPNSRSTVAAVDHYVKWSLKSRFFVKAFFLILGFLALCEFVGLVGLAWNTYYGNDDDEQLNNQNSQDVEKFLSSLALHPPP